MLRRHGIARHFRASIRYYTSRRSKPPSKPRSDLNQPSRLYEALRTSLICVQAFLAYHLLSSYVADICRCEGPSMLPTLPLNCNLLIQKTYARGHGVIVGDLVEIAHPLVPGAGAVKRVTGMPGDFVVVDMVNDESTIVQSPQQSSQSDVELDEDGKENIMVTHLEREGIKMLQVPEGHCWVLGDNLPDSRDSRYYGPVPLALIRGKVVAQVLPFAERKWIRNGMERVGNIDMASQID